ncbi:MAG: hypothetical protein ACLF0P_10720 [Thermoanaerobaculia bacterium]
MHVSAFLYAAAERGELPWKVLFEIERRHLAARCPDCRPGVEAFLEGRASEAARDSAPSLDPLEGVRRRRGLTRRQLQHEAKVARKWLRTLVQKVPQGKRSAKVNGAYKHYRGSVFGVLLLEEARKAIRQDAAESLSLAEATLASCRVTHPDDPDPHVWIPALAVRGNALRALGRLRQAEETLEEAVELLDSSELDDIAVAAELDSYLGSLRKDQLRLGEASRHLERAGLFYSLLNDGANAAATFDLLGIVHHRAHELDAAVDAVRKALELLGPSVEGRQAAYARYNLAVYLHARGDTAEAEAELQDHADLLAGAGEMVAAHVTWLRARIAWSRGKLAAADRLFREALAWARSRKLHFDAGLLSLERALVHLARGRTDRVRKLAKEALALFAREEEVERETRAALEVLEAAARRDALTRKALEKAVATLDGARHRRPAGDSPGE